jgi:hypothetical protein
MKKSTILLLLFAALFIAACGDKPAPTPEAPATAEPDLSIVIGEKFGLITPANCTREGVLAAYGNDAKADSLYIIDGMYGEGVVLFPDNPRRRVEIYWDKDFDPKRPSYIRIDGDSTGVSEWKTAEGITLGTSLAELEKLNGKPFEISGFGWDYGGFVTDWKGGKFNTALTIRMEPTAEGDASAKVSGEGGYNSQNPDMQAAKPIVSRMEFRFLANEKLPDCVMEKVKADKEQGRMNVLKINVNGSDLYWLQSGAAAYDGIEYVYEVAKDGHCEEACQMGGLRMPPPCQKLFEGKQWELVWEEK